MITDEQIDSLKDTTGDTLAMVSDFLNSASLWELLGSMVGLVLCVALVCAIIAKVYSWVGFYSR